MQCSIMIENNEYFAPSGNYTSYNTITKCTHPRISPAPSIGTSMIGSWREEAQKNILRTHTTAVSARMLYKIGQQEKFTPVKYFSIDRVFRYETLDVLLTWQSFIRLREWWPTLT